MKRLLAAAVLLSLATASVAAEDTAGKIRLRGEWEDGILRAKRPEPVQPRDLRGDGVAGWIDEAGDGWFRIGPIRVDVVEDTEFREIGPADLVPGQAVKVRGTLVERRRIEAGKIRPTSIKPEDVQIWGLPSGRTVLEDGSERVTLLGVRASMPPSKEEILKQLVRRPEDVRPDEQKEVAVFGRPLTIGGDVENDFRARIDNRLQPQREDDDVRVSQEFELELLYEWSEQVSVLLTGKASYKADLYREDDREDFEGAVERDETWIYFSEMFGTGLSLQVGRQEFRERLNWWWDQDLDAARLHFDSDRLHLEAGVARNVARSDSSQDDPDDPATDKALRVLAHASWKWHEDHRLEGFFVYTSGDINEPAPGSVVPEDFDTIPEPDLHWFGGRVRGKGEATAAVALDYHLQAAWVEGSERYSVLEDTDDDQQLVLSRETISVSGWGVDGALTGKLRDVPGRPALTLGGAAGSADEKDDVRLSGGFRQTGLQSNRARFEGVNRIRYYGELYRPGLANMAISTAMLTTRFWEKSSFEAAFHSYHQLESAPFVWESAISTRPDGNDKYLGWELDFVLNVREWDNIDLRAVYALFRAGDAYGTSSGEVAHLLSLSFDYGF